MGIFFVNNKKVDDYVNKKSTESDIVLGQLKEYVHRRDSLYTQPYNFAKDKLKPKEAEILSFINLVEYALKNNIDIKLYTGNTVNHFSNRPLPKVDKMWIYHNKYPEAGESFVGNISYMENQDEIKVYKTKDDKDRTCLDVAFDLKHELTAGEKIKLINLFFNNIDDFIKSFHTYINSVCKAI